MTRKIVIQSRVSEFEADLLKQLADEQRVTYSEYMRSLIRIAAQKRGLLPNTTETVNDKQTLAA